MISRRTFARGSASALAFSVLTGKRAFSATTESRSIEIQPDAVIGTIRPELHSHFQEHLGSCTYGGLWVGRDSPIPNINGHRRQAVEYLRELGVPVLRWPGGCFADDYHWRDGIGPPEDRPSSVNIHWGNYTEDNSFGTHEFIDLCRLIGAEPYLAGNVGSGTPEELRDWVEYCNYPEGSSLSDERARNGSPEPFNVRYWGIGNENWGCGGNMRPEEYAGHYRRYSSYVRSFGDTDPFKIACGPSGNDASWTEGYFGNRGRPDGYAMHYYSNGRAPATEFDVDSMEAQFASFPLVERAILEQRALIDKFDPQKRVGLMVDEWGVWDQMVPEEEEQYGKLWQQITIRGGVAAALGLNVFQRQADKLVMCNIAQIVNVLHAMLLTRDEHCIRTPAYYAFELEKPHRGQTAIQVENEDEGPTALSVSASRNEGQLVVTFVNPKHDTALSVNCNVAGSSVSGASARSLYHADLNACNTFEAPDTVTIQDHQANASGSSIQVELPPLSVTTVTARIA